MNRLLRLSSAALLVPVLATACVPVEIAPPPEPPPTIPSLPGDATTTPAAGFTRVRLTSDVPARVYLHADAVGAARGRGPRDIETLVCERTPCAFVVPYGDHEVLVQGTEPAENARREGESYAERSGAIVVHAHAPEVVVNHTLGWQHSPAGRAGAGTLIGMGVVLAIAAGALTKNAHATPDAAVGTAVAGLGAIVLGSVILGAVPSVEQPGATREWTPPQGATAGGSLGFKF